MNTPPFFKDKFVTVIPQQLKFLLPIASKNHSLHQKIPTVNLIVAQEQKKIVLFKNCHLSTLTKVALNFEGSRNGTKKKFSNSSGREVCL